MCHSNEYHIDGLASNSIIEFFKMNSTGTALRNLKQNQIILRFPKLIALP
jgi:hypothetical protein